MSDRDLLEQIAATVREAGARALQLFRDGCAVSEKPDCSPVTEADLAAEAIIFAGLSRYAHGIPVVAEEACADGRIPAVDREFFLVDPIDGTKSFVARDGDWTVNVGLVRDGAPVLGVAMQPTTDTLYLGIVGEGAWRERGGQREPIRARPVPTASPVALISRDYYDEQTAATLDRLGAHQRIPVGSSLKLCLLAAGEGDVVARHAPCSEWDTAAAHAVLLAAGGATELIGAQGPLTYGKPGFRNPGFIAWGARP